VERDGERRAGRLPGEAVAGAVLAAAWLAAAFAAAGTLRWGAGWIYAGATVAGLAAHRAYVSARNPGLPARRDRVGEGTRGWDVAWVMAFWPLMVAVPVVAGAAAVRLVRPALPAWTALAGAALLAAGLGLSAAAMAANPFFEGTARIQPDQRVVEAGPYGVVRHPGYAGLALWALSGPFLLRSAEALAPAALAAAWVAVRTALEDRMLRRGLAGYAAYAARVRWRLAPGIW